VRDAQAMMVPPSLLDTLAEQSAVMAGLEKFTSYNITVLCFTDPGDGLRSQPVEVRTDEDGKSCCMTRVNKSQMPGCPGNCIVQCFPLATENRHFFYNFTTNEDIATKFEADYRHIPLHFSHNERTPV